MPTTSPEQREANRRHQATWRKKHWQIYNELVRIVGELGQSANLIDRLDNHKLAERIRTAVKLMEGE
jgi:hypothetical protein